jgi:hypothetical protein
VEREVVRDRDVGKRRAEHRRLGLRLRRRHHLLLPAEEGVWR